MELSPRGTVDELRLVRIKLERVQAVGLIASVDITQPVETAHQKCRADEEHQRERSLADDERIASPMMASRSRASALAQPGEFGPARAPGWYACAGQHDNKNKDERDAER